jgi:hypothetical protein
MHMTRGRVEDGRGSASAPSPVPAHQTGHADFPHPAFRLVSPRACGGRSIRALFHIPTSPWLRGQACLKSSWSHAVLRGLAPSHRPSPASTSTPEVRALPSAGVTQPQQYYDPVRHPPEPSPEATLRPLPSPMMGLPQLPGSPFRHAVPTTPMDQSGCVWRLLPRSTRAFPVSQAGRRP